MRSFAASLPGIRANFSRRGAALVLIALFALPGLAGDKPAHTQLVDSGTFGIFVSGQRIGTEKFRIERTADESSLTSSEVTVEDSNGRASQSSELQVSGKGDLMRYSWQEQTPGRAQSVVEPSDAVLLQRITLNATDKPINQKYLLPTSTLILDDYFFVHREILAWRFLAGVCTPSPEGLRCKTGRGEFPVLVPRQQTSASVAIEFSGTEELMFKGAKHKLSRFVLRTASGDPSAGGLPDSVDWTIWLDSENKLVRVVAAGMEVVRD